MPVAFDTLTYAKKLRDAGFTQEQAEVQAHALADIVEERLATKQDIATLHHAIKELETSLRHDMKELETSLKRDIKELETSLRHDIKELETSLQRDMKDYGIPDDHPPGRHTRRLHHHHGRTRQTLISLLKPYDFENSQTTHHCFRSFFFVIPPC